VNAGEPTHNEIVVIRYGTRESRRSEVFLNHWASGEADGPLRMDYYFWLIRTPSGPILIDCGFGSRAGAARGRTLLVDPVAAAAALGAGPETAPRIIVTHEHYDHIGNLDRFPHSRIHVARAELEFWRRPVARRPLFAMVSESDELSGLDRADAEGRVITFEDETSPSPGVRVLRVGGHTAGQSIVLVDTVGGTVLLSSDAVHYVEELENDRPFVHLDSLPGMYAALDRVRELLASGQAVRLVPGHDPGVFDDPAWQPVPELPMYARRLVLPPRKGSE
jgi:glyoxylase-like metal-dependent hydrolase (beta-lactamase superfamily II)